MLPNITYTLQHLKGHSDDVTDVLSRWETLNIMVDQLAKDRRRQIESSNVSSTWWPQIPCLYWRVTLDNDRRVCKYLTVTLTSYVSHHNMSSYWEKRNIISTEQFNNIDWIGVGKAMKASTITRKQWIVKHAVGICGVNKVLKLWKKRDDDTCPWCSEVETSQHVILCNQPEENQIWDAHLLSLSTWLKTTTSSDITNQLIDYLRMWRQDNIPTLIPANHKLAQIQQQMGWNNVIEGRLGTCWRSAHQSNSDELGRKGSSVQWITSLIIKLWETAWDLWEHRNGIAHANDESTEMAKVDHLISLKLILGFDSLPLDRHLYNKKELKIQKTAKISCKRHWIYNITQARARANRRGQLTTRDFDHMRTIMRSHFQPQSETTTEP
jgi:hypothetical protein